MAHTLVRDSNSVTRREIPPMWTAGVKTGAVPKRNIFYTVVMIKESMLHRGDPENPFKVRTAQAFTRSSGSISLSR